MENNKEVIFSNIDNLNTYNEKLLNEFINYLNMRHKKCNDVFDCNVRIQIIENEELIQDFLQLVMLK